MKLPYGVPYKIEFSSASLLLLMGMLTGRILDYEIMIDDGFPLSDDDNEEYAKLLALKQHILSEMVISYYDYTGAWDQYESDS